MEGVVDHTDSNSEHEDDFYFESDHLALRDNSDYTALLKTIAILEVQKTQCLKDIDQLVEAERRALEDPLEFIEKLKKGEDLNFPKRIDIQEIPNIDLDKYNVKIPEAPKCEPKQSPNKNGNLVRGRVFDQTKPETFNQLWTFEEQKRLEELLQEYSPEPYESQRFMKIAKALGNRTPKQVASRVQKFFMKLHAAGLPIPGRLPKNLRGNTKYSKQQKKSRVLRPSTFFPAENVPVKMTDNDDFDLITPAMHHKVSVRNSRDEDKTDRDEFTQLVVVSHESEEDLKNLSEKEKILRLLKRVRSDLEIPNRSDSSHYNFKCDNCLSEPIVGTRWHCNSCIVPIDFCSDCMIEQVINPNKRHSLDHVFIGIRMQPVELSSKFTDFSYSTSNYPSASNSRLQSEASDDEDPTDQNSSD